MKIIICNRSDVKELKFPNFLITNLFSIRLITNTLEKRRIFIDKKNLYNFLKLLKLYSKKYNNWNFIEILTSKGEKIIIKL